jgi:hypothetical protein
MLLLYPENIDFIKREMKSRLTAVRSSHLIEAFAAAANYKTYAAMLADIKESPPRHPPLRRISDDSFQERLKELGYEHIFCVSQTIRSNGLPTSCWRQFANKDPYSNNIWFYRCRDFGIPNVYIKSRTKYVKLCWDCISIRPEHETTIKDDRQKIMKDMYAKFCSAVGPKAPGKPLFWGTAFVGSIDNIALEPAMTLADSLFETLYMAMDP